MSPSSCRTKSKTGCRTCKVRKIKCDELMPECRRCTSTGRKCDGYGIWGGGDGWSINKYHPQRHRSQSSSLSSRGALAEYRANPTRASPRTFCVYPASALDADEKAHLEWFWCRTSRKIQGAFFSDAATTVLLQASASDLAVTHAMLALCSVHKRADMSILVKHEESFALVQYNKAIKYLQPKLMAHDRTSLRLCLLACVAFIHLEFFRCHYQMARSHLEHGLRMLDCLRALSNAASSGEGLDGKQSRHFVDVWIVRNLRSLYLQSTLFGQQPHRPWAVVDHLQRISAVGTFSSAHHAREYLENLLLRICRMTDTPSRPSPTQTDGRACPTPSSRPRDIDWDLQSWKAVFDQTWATSRSTINGLEAFAYRLLLVYHTMAEIMVDTMCGTAESRFDRHTARFVSMLEQILGLRDTASRSQVRQRFFGSEHGLSHSIADMGLMAPLFYVAVKCRVRCLRLQAIRLIAEIPRKEGIWDATLVARIAAQVVAVEEANVCSSSSPDVSVFDHDLLPLPDAHLSEPFQILPISQLPLPSASRRVEAIQVLLPDGPWDPVILKCSYQDHAPCDTYLIDWHGRLGPEI
ncbi:hypothetical protein AYL99_03270 [Fonsecaea erecta]|uniref:Zn(2)-C6 fungal-type domain-containing protein n=1 Tax=Fonsecaea erecta TaxID=1367422 RepID=A0A178ZMP3_9EURO|nr:hypothetical protein AYL99_03270 [Fonsecaea erecta]OAP61069.1 hypothetical protein AYL99_03270 [Fonsecaea erecta]